MINIPNDVRYILNKIINNGYEAFIAGGCVRDSLLGVEPKDWDITTSAKPEDIKKIFPLVLDTGIKHGTVTIVLNNNLYDVTTYRIDGNYRDGRKPENVMYTNKLEYDLSRRDFTINAMAYNEYTGLIDLYGGINDLNYGIIRCVGDSYSRLEKEDRLRKLRAVRFASQLTFKLDEDIIRVIRKYNSLSGVSKERIQSEFNKILLSKNAGYGVRLLYELGLFSEFIPEFSRAMIMPQNDNYPIYTVGMHSIITCGYKELPNKIHVKLAALLHDIGKIKCKTNDFNGYEKYSLDMAVKILKRLKYGNSTIDKVNKLILYHNVVLYNHKKLIKKVLNDIGEELFSDLLYLKFADINAQHPYFIKDRHNKLYIIKRMYEDIINNSECYRLRDLAINGNDLKRIGFKEGKIIGTVLYKLLDMVMDNPSINNREDLLRIASGMKGYQR